MTDFFDRAQAQELADREAAIEATRKQVNVFTPSAEFCEMPDCEAAIPDARRTAVPGCQFCAGCQTRIEKNPALKRRYL